MSFRQNLRSNSGWADDPEWRRFVGRWAAVSLLLIAVALLWFIPYLAVRTSSESLSGDFFAIGVALLMLGSSAAEAGGRRFPIAALLTAGLCFGLAFDFRYQIAFAVAGVVFWIGI